MNSEGAKGATNLEGRKSGSQERGGRGGVNGGAELGALGASDFGQPAGLAAQGGGGGGQHVGVDHHAAGWFAAGAGARAAVGGGFLHGLSVEPVGGVVVLKSEILAKRSPNPFVDRDHAHVLPIGEQADTKHPNHHLSLEVTVVELERVHVKL